MLLHARTRRRGTVVVLVALALMFIVGMAAVTLDGGLLLDKHRQAQTAADAGALAAATVVYHDRSVTGTGANAAARAAAVAVAKEHGYTDDQITVRISPEAPLLPTPTTTVSGQLRTGYIEVTINELRPRYFSRIWGTEDVPVSARAVARGRWKPHGDGVIVLDLDEPRALQVSGGGSPPLNLVITGQTDIIVNSQETGSQGATAITGGASLTAPGGVASGSVSTDGGGSVNIPGGFRQAPPTPDPLRDLPPIDPYALGLPVINGKSHYTKDAVLLPGIYPNGLTLGGGGPDGTNPTKYILTSGVYYIAKGGFTVTGQASVEVVPAATGILIYNASAPNGLGQGESGGIVNADREVQRRADHEVQRSG